MSNTSNLIGKEFTYIPTGIIYKIYSVREYRDSNHKVYLENLKNLDEQVTEFLFELSNSEYWKENK